MGREEFLRGLAQALSGHVPQNVIQENLNYYDGYIRQEVQNGRTENEVIGEIGTPRLIARTIIDASGGTDDGFEEAGNDAYQSGSASYQDGRGFYRSEYDEEIYNEDGKREHGGFHIYDFSSGWKKYALIGGVILVVFLILSIVGGLLSMLMPVLAPLCVLWLIYMFIRGSRR